MKYFPQKLESFNGIFHYLWSKKNFLPHFSTNCDTAKGEIKDLIIDTENAYVQLDIDEDNNEEGYSFLTFELKNQYKIIPFSYQFSTVFDTSPPVNWTFSGTNDLYNEWQILDSNVNDSLCLRQTTGFPNRCQNRAVVTFTISDSFFIGPFKYFKFTLYSNRASTSLYDMRFGGFEIYGIVYEENEYVLYKKTCKLLFPYFYNLFLCMTLICIK